MYEEWLNLLVFRSLVNLQHRVTTLDCDDRFALPSVLGKVTWTFSRPLVGL